MRIITLTLLFLFMNFQIIAGEGDSLKALYDKATTDSLKARYGFGVADHYLNIDIELSILWGNKALNHARKHGDKLFIVKSIIYDSYYFSRKGDYLEQIKMCLEALKIADQNEFNDQKGVIASNIGGAYLQLGDDKQALKWLEDAITLKKQFNDDNKLATSLSTLGAYYFSQGNYLKAVQYHEESLKIDERSGNQNSLAIDLANLADCYIEMDEFEKAESLLNQALSIRQSLEDNFGEVKTLMDFAFLYERRNIFPKAIQYALKSKEIAESNGFEDLLYENLLLLADLHKSNGNFKEADTYRELALQHWQNLFSIQTSYNLNEVRTIYETERITNENLLLRKQKEIDLLNNERSKAANNRLRMIVLSVVVGMLVLGLILILFIRLNRSKRKANLALSEQKKLVEIKNEEILDSIKYAKRIQTAILPSMENVVNQLKHVFIMYQPKDVVAGDFYWLETKDNWKLFAVADCTGHGVPGAMVSVFGNNALNRAVREHNLTKPGEILDKAREIMINEFEKNGEEVHDGMDVALCALNGNKLRFAGAYNSLWIVRHGELLEYRGDKQPIGLFDKKKTFETVEIELMKDDCFYIFSDGFADQFGGPNNKKYKSANLKRLLIKVSDKPMIEQAQLIQQDFDEWKGDNEQVDDVCLLGVRYQD